MGVFPINQSQHAITQDSDLVQMLVVGYHKKHGSTNPNVILICGASCNPIIHKKEMIRAIIVMVLNYWLWLSVIIICTNLKKRKSYLYEIGESVQNGHGPFDLAIRMVSDSYSVRWNFAIPIWNRTVGCEYSNKRNMFSRIVPVTWYANIIQSCKSWAKEINHQSYKMEYWLEIARRQPTTIKRR